MEKWNDKYRSDIAGFLASPGGKYFIASLIAKETQLWADAAEADNPYAKAAGVDVWKGVYFCRDLLARWSQPKKALSKEGQSHSDPPIDIDMI
jgi:hypothetical protein